ncbi:MAG: DNA-3-methyladenine glycosylase 2 family protein [Limnochordia bacterium]|nr:DNA-3-methyladenine glycosylase 2 family protein [Limnochordia bacterium]
MLEGNGSLRTYTTRSKEIQFLSSNDERISSVISLIGTLAYRIHNNHYSFMVKTIIGQSLSSKVADILVNRVEILCKGCVTPQAMKNIDKSHLYSAGLSTAKIKYIEAFSDAVIESPDYFMLLKNLSDQEIIDSLIKIHGIGSWSAKMFLIFALDRKNVLPYEDGAFIKAYSWLYNSNKLDFKSVEANCAKWRPYSSIATRYMYKLLDYGYTKSNLRDIGLG